MAVVIDPSVAMTPARLGDRALFPELVPHYLNHAAMGPPSLRVRAAVAAYLGESAARGAAFWPAGIAQRDRLRGKLAALLGVASTDVALTPSTTRALCDLSLCLPWRAGDRIVCFQGEFPTNVTPWQAAARTFGAEVVMGSLAGFAGSAESGLAALEAELRRGVRLVAVSAVQFQTGLAMPLAELAALCHRYGAEIAVDAMQGLGVVPLDAGALGLDYVASGSHKWLGGPEGAGLLYVRPDRLGSLVQRVAGWQSHEEPASFLFPEGGALRYDRPLRRRIDWLEVGAQHALGFVGWEAGLDAVMELGVPAIFAHVQRYHDALEPALVELGLRSLRDADPRRRSGILSFRTPGPVGPVFRALAAAGVAVSTPEGVLRFSPGWCNPVEAIGEVVAAVRGALG